MGCWRLVVAKNMPGAMIAIARENIPAIFVYGGTIKPGHYNGRDNCCLF